MLNITNNSVKSHIVEEELSSLTSLHLPKSATIIYRWLMGIFCFLFMCLFLPWQQNISGKGYISTLYPKDRPQNIQNIVAGQIQQWNVREGDFVKKGDTLVVISDIKDDYFDPQVLQRTNEQILAKTSGLDAYKNKVSALDNQLLALKQGMDLSLQKAKNKFTQATLKVRSDSADFLAVQKNYQISKERLNRGEQMFKEGAISLTDLETRRMKWQEDQAKSVAQEQKWLIARNELTNARIELSSVMADYQKDISKAESDRSSAVSSVAEGQGELSKLQNKYANINIRRNLYVIKAPQDGFVVKTLKAGIGETIKESESLILFQPKNDNLAVELYVKAMDLPIVQKNQHVRLEFDGWPALQFSGWPGSSVGTFGGRVAVIDQISVKNGEYRLLIVPDHQANENDSWPKELRIGSGAKGFVMLKDVPIWWELWRQLNGFPPDYLDDIKTEEKAK